MICTLPLFRACWVNPGKAFEAVFAPFRGVRGTAKRQNGWGGKWTPDPTRAALPERRWQPLPEYELADVAELCYQPTGWERPYRYVAKRELAEPNSGALHLQ